MQELNNFLSILLASQDPKQDESRINTIVTEVMASLSEEPVTEFSSTECASQTLPHTALTLVADSGFSLSLSSSSNSFLLNLATLLAIRIKKFLHVPVRVFFETPLNNLPIPVYSIQHRTKNIRAHVYFPLLTDERLVLLLAAEQKQTFSFTLIALLCSGKLQWKLAAESLAVPVQLKSYQESFTITPCEKVTTIAPELPVAHCPLTASQLLDLRSGSSIELPGTLPEVLCFAHSDERYEYAHIEKYSEIS